MSYEYYSPLGTPTDSGNLKLPGMTSRASSEVAVAAVAAKERQSPESTEPTSTPQQYVETA